MRALGTMSTPGSSGLVSPTVAPYPPSTDYTCDDLRSARLTPWLRPELCSFPALQVAPKMIRAILLASATVTSMRGLRVSICSSHEPFGAPRLRACRTTALLPMMSRRLSVRSPILDVAPSFCLPPVDL